MISSLFRDPVGMASSQYPIRQSEEAAALLFANGDDVPSCLSDAAKDRVPEVSVFDSSTDVTTRSTGRTHQESLRGPKGSLLSVRQESALCRAQEDAASDGLLGQAWPCGGRSSGRRSPAEEDGIQASTRSEGPCRSHRPGEARKDFRIR